MRAPTSVARRLAALAVAVLCFVGAACSSGSDAEEMAAPAGHAGHGGGAPHELVPVAGDPVALGPDDDLYTPPDPLPAGAHGTLLTYQEVEPSTFPSARTVRILYLSQDLHGQPIAVSGVVFVPLADAPAAGRPVVGLAHATTGLADECAPSRTMGAEIPLLGPFTEAGQAVVVSDYAGLGTPGRHPYLVGASAGRSVLDAVLAAQQLPDADLGDRVGLAGYSQGGQGALWADRLAASWAPDLEVVGTVAGAPATELGSILSRPTEVPFSGFVPMVVSGLAAASSLVDPASYLTPAGLEVQRVAETGCLADVEEAVAGLDAADLVLPGAAGSTAWSSAAAANDPGLAPGTGPVLILHSEADDTIPVATSEAVAERLCAAGQDVERRVMTDGADHVVGAVGSYAQALPWLEARFAGDPVSATTC